MTTDKIDRTHGSTGNKPPDGKEFVDGERPDDEQFDWFWYIVPNKIDSIIDDISAIVNGSTQVGDAASADDATNVTSTYKGNDIDTDGDGKVDSADVADNAIAYKGNDLDTDGDGQVDAADSVPYTGVSNHPTSTATHTDPETAYYTVVSGSGTGGETVGIYAFVTDVRLSDASDSSATIEFADGTSVSGSTEQTVNKFATNATISYDQSADGASVEVQLRRVTPHDHGLN